MPLQILILGDDTDVLRQLHRLIDLHPAWKMAGALAFDKALTGKKVRCPPDVVIMDLNPFDAGLLRRISAVRGKFGSSPILALSAHQDSGLVLRMIHAGASGYLIMHRAAEELAAAIETIAAGGTYLSPGIAGLTKRRPSI